MELVASRADEWQLYKAGEKYFESKIKLSEEELASNGEELLMNSGNLKQLAFSHDSIKGWFNDQPTREDFDTVMQALEPIIISLWDQGKLNSWIMEIY